MQVVVGLAMPSDDEGIRALMRRQIMPGRVRLAMPREPQFSLGCAVTGDDYRVLVARSTADGAIVGVACRAVRRAFINGHETRVGYLGQLRIDERFRGRWLVARGFALLQQIDRRDPVPVHLVSIVDGNDEASGVLVTRRRPSYPVLSDVTAYCTLALPLRRPKPAIDGPDAITAATAGDVADVVRFLRLEGRRRQFFPVWTEDALHRLTTYGLSVGDLRIARRQGAIVGVMALWDQTAYKQAVVCGYSGWMRVLATLSSVGRSFGGRGFLPHVGDEIRSAYASLVCVADDDAQVFARLLRDVYNAAASRGFDYLLVGLDARDRYLGVARSYSHYSYPSRLYLGSWTDTGSQGELHAPDSRLAYVDIATL